MALEYPVSFPSSSGFNGVTVANLDTIDGNWATWDGNTSPQSIVAQIGTPTNSPVTTTDGQSILVEVRRTQTNATPTVTIEVSDDNGTSWTTLASGVSVTSTTGETLGPYNWTFAGGASDGSEVRVRITANTSGGGPNETGVDVGYITWNAEGQTGTTHTASGTIAASATLAAIVDIRRPRTAAVAASASLRSLWATTTNGAVSFTEAPTITGTVAESQTLTVNDEVTYSATAAISSSASLTASATVSGGGTITRTAAIQATAGLSVARPQSAFVAATSSLRPKWSTSTNGAVSFDAKPTISGTVEAGQALTINDAVTYSATATFAATASVIATGSVAGTITATASIAATATLSATAARTSQRSAAIAATASLAATGARTASRTASVGATASVTASASKTSARTAAISATASIAATVSTSSTITATASCIFQSLNLLKGFISSPLPGYPRTRTYPPCGYQSLICN